MVVVGWLATVFWVLGAMACFTVGLTGAGEWGLPWTSPAQPIPNDVAGGPAVSAWLCGGMAIGMAALTAICTVGLTILRRMAADVAGLRADLHRDRQERQSDATAILERLPPHR